QNVTAILKPQFAPIEQYAETQSMRQGPWTDLYALAGTCYFMLTGRAPLPATARVMGDELEPLVRLAPPGCSAHLLQILDWAMAVRPQDRPQSVAQFRDALAERIEVPVSAGTNAAAADPATASSSYEKTIQATMRVAPPGQAPASETRRTVSAAPAAHRPLADDLDLPERSVMLPPKSKSPLKALLLILVLAAVGAGAWTTRSQWMPAVGLRLAALPAAASASAAVAPASAAASMSLALVASAPVVDAVSAAASTAPLAASDAAASAAASSASVAPTPVPVPLVVVEAPSAPPVAAKPTPTARERALAARIAALKLPPPVLPPENESHIVGSAHGGANAPSAAVEATAAAASAAPRDVGPREACADQGPGKMAACVKRLCDTYSRYQGYLICQRVRRHEELQ
ncbi:MAG: hypothetical protein ABJD97_17635, partial [Betaproteobacteria bacterium]